MLRKLTRYRRIEYFSGPRVTVRVQGRDFRLPKDLLRYNSSFFEEKLREDGAANKPDNTAIVIPQGSPETFEMVVQWMITANVVPRHDQLDNNPSGEAQEVLGKEENTQRKTEGPAVELTVESPSFNSAKTPRGPCSSNLTSHIQFFKMAHEISLLGPFDVLLRRMRTTLVSSNRLLLPSHIRRAAELPRGHEVRKLIAQACVAPYISDSKVQGSREFRFGVELREVEAFAADLFCEYNLVVRQGSVEMDSGRLSFLFTDPLTGRPVRLPCHYSRI